MDKYFYLPGYYIYNNLLSQFIKYKKENPQFFLKDRIIAGSYDIPFGLIWNGGRGSQINYGRATYNETWTNSVMQQWFKQPDFILLHTCTNLFINTPERLHDKICNSFIEKYYRPQDKIIIANPDLKKYLKETYPEISFVNSTTIGLTDISTINKLTENEIYVLNYNKNGDNEYLKQLTHPENIEILCGEHCVANCPNRRKHYEEVSKIQLKEIEKSSCVEVCPF